MLYFNPRGGETCTFLGEYAILKENDQRLKILRIQGFLNVPSAIQQKRWKK